ncbi:phage tail assembly chaperone [Kluyvera sp. NPDC087067]|uniref:phage tail assembly chaperone n=1 Tax=Kluyvera sp. NPDC087067 TaxID=3364105 RepID=UPI00381D0D69
MTKFSLIPNPTFSATASIPRAGADDGKLTVTFRHKTLEELRAMDEQLHKKAGGKKAPIEPQADYLMEIVDSWALPDEFTRDNVIVLLKNYPRAFDSIGLAYTKELMGIREKN